MQKGAVSAAKLLTTRSSARKRPLSLASADFSCMRELYDELETASGETPFPRLDWPIDSPVVQDSHPTRLPGPAQGKKLPKIPGHSTRSPGDTESFSEDEASCCCARPYKRSRPIVRSKAFGSLSSVAGPVMDSMPLASKDANADQEILLPPSDQIIR